MGLPEEFTLQSKLIICHLHALTSSCLPDELTGKTGTEAALTILRSAALRSFEYLKEEDLMKLSKIARLSPERVYYPKNLRCMETVHWDGKLGFICQDNDFYTSVQSIFSQASATAFFYPGLYKDAPSLHYIDGELEKRHAIRTASFHVCGFGAEKHTTDHDVLYQSRDRPSYSERSHRAFKVARMMARSQESLVESLNHGLVDQIWSSLKGDTKGLTGQMLAQEICYDSRWLEDQTDLFRQYWCQLHRFLDGRFTQLNRFRTMLCLSTMGYAKTGCLQLLQVLAAFAKIRNLCKVDVPAGQYFSLHQGRAAVRSDILQIVRLHLKEFFDCPESRISRHSGENEYDFSNRRYNEFTANRDSAVDRFTTMVYAQWICAKPELLSVDGTYVDSSAAIQAIRQKWKFWYDNHCFYEYLCQIVTVLVPCSVEAIAVPEKKTTTISHLQPRKAKPFITTQNLFAFAPALLPLEEQTQLAQCLTSTVPAETGARLTGLLERLKANISSKQPYQAKYATELERSLLCLENQMASQALPLGEEELRGVLAENARQCQLQFDSLYSVLQTAIESNLKAQFLSTTSGDIDSWQVPATFMAPRMSPSILLSNLAQTRWDLFSSDWKEALVALGVAVTKVQRAKRLKQTKLMSDLVKELSNAGHMNWDPLNSPETLLLEIESGILIRDVQEDIALQMRDPPDGKNAVMQLNMGEGKSSVIVPIVAAHLADGSRLVRVIVAKPQAKELFRTLVSKLGGLLNRRICHMPFNRMLRLTAQQANSLHKLYIECMEQGGILLLQPEHMLSFKLMAIEYQSLADRGTAGTALLDVYHFFETHSRDIVDESDENFSPKFELIYTMGAQRPIELSPERWTVLQRLLSIVASVAPSIKQEFPGSIEITHHGKGRFPRTRVLRADAADLLLRRVTQKICDTGLPGLPIARQSDEMRQAVFEYIFEKTLDAHQISLVEENTAFFTDTVRGPLLLLRGLVSGAVLLFALCQKRWRVNYGLDANRHPSTKLAVPYRAKDCPSPRSEFSHPDVVILLTCLTYYYEGLTDDALFISFSHLIGSDQADTEYQEWVADSPALAASFHRLAGVNIKDREQMTQQIFPHIRHAKRVVDYFLSHLVFPKEMKEFSHKLSASGWDFGHQKRHATTGFSGTNDSRYVLPLDVAQLDLEAQRHTNALVLEHLLRPENKVQLLRPISDGEISDVEKLFKFAAATENGVHVILDVGAQILELKNMQVAERWLQMLPLEHQQEAGIVERLQTSPYVEQLDRCVVFLDQAHTRGTDLKLPEHYRAAVTLGPDLTKDKLVQACMRMRKLGKGQSVVFCVSEEMHSRINLATGRAPDYDIGVDDVLMWAISETHADLYRLMPLWAIQGIRFERQKKVWDEAATANGICMSQENAEQLLEAESQSIEQRYRPIARDIDKDRTSPFGDVDLERAATLRAIQARCDEFGVSNFRSAALQEEQEKELAPEIEQERQIERPMAALPEPHQVHPDLVYFVAAGRD
ncbi:hypothetical protein NQ176_g6330 [Zarea fungicola]|uniref:Uncharacterized protein n=1 Tax=Zarea fungicola TaxID=93591 RepID=A0ACC1N617_9HYPO|nr:hypothetical protein NQ176_g6330 [Lecanicillium fungicola]